MNYNSKQWKQVTKNYRRMNPICEKCDEQRRVTPATHTSHIVPVDQGGEPLDEENLIALCRSHYHNRKEFARHYPPTEVIIICGPPGAGKTTYVRERIQPGEVVFDLDAIYQALTFQPEHVKPEEVEDLVFRIRDKVYEWIKQPNKVNRAYIITSVAEEEKRRELVKLFSAKAVMLDKPAEVCKQRIKSQGRPATKDWELLVDEWHTVYASSETYPPGSDTF